MNQSSGSGSNFESLIGTILSHEGGYSTDPDDRGNWTGGQKGKGELKGTKYGIAAHVYPHLDIKNLTREQAVEIYRRDYWDRIDGDSIPEEIRAISFDSAVNHGVGRAREFIQSSGGNLDRFIQQRHDFYHSIVQRRPSQEKFLRGWMNRLNSFRPGAGSQAETSNETSAPESHGGRIGSLIDTPEISNAINSSTMSDQLEPSSGGSNWAELNLLSLNEYVQEEIKRENPGLPSLPGNERVDDPYSISEVSEHSMLPTTDFADRMIQGSAQIGQAGIINEQRLKALEDRYQSQRFVPTTMSQALAARQTDYRSSPTDMLAVGRQVNEEISDAVKRRQRLRDGNYQAAWLNSAQSAFEWWDRKSQPFKAEEGFDGRQWMADNKVDSVRLSQIREGRYYDFIQSSRSKDEAAYYLALSQIREKNLERINASSPGTAMAMSLVADLTNPLYYPSYFIGGAAIRGAKTAGLVSRTALGGQATLRSQIAYEVTAEAINSAYFVLAQSAMGEIKTGADALLDVTMGVSMGAAGGVMFGRSGARIAGEQHARWVTDAVEDGRRMVQADQYRAELHTKAVQELPPGFTDKQLAEKITELESKAVKDHARAQLTDIPDAEKLIAHSIHSEQQAKKLMDELDKREKAIAANAKRAARREEVSAQNAEADRIDAENLAEYERAYGAWRARTTQEASQEAMGVTPQNKIDEADAPELEGFEEIARIDDEIESLTRFELSDDIRARANNASIPKGKTLVKVELESDLDRAAWLLNSAKKMTQKNRQEVIQLIKDSGLDPNKVSAYGKLMHQRARKLMDSGEFSSSAPINISKMVDDSDRARIFGESRGRITPAQAADRLNPTDIDSVRRGFNPRQAVRGGNPRYKNFNLTFRSDYERAAYILGETDNRSASRGGLEQAMRDAGLDIQAARELGKEMRQAIKNRVGDAQKGNPIDVSSLIPESRMNEILKGNRAKVVSREKARADRLLEKEPVKPEPVGRQRLKPEELVDESVKSIDEIREEMGLTGIFDGIQDLKEALTLKLIHDRVNEMKVSKREQSKVNLAGKLTRFYEKAHARSLNPIATRLLASESPVLKKFAAMMLENPTGAINSVTAAMTKTILHRQLMGNVYSKYNLGLTRYLELNGQSTISRLVDRRKELEFDRKVFLWQENKRQGKMSRNQEMFSPEEQKILEPLGEELDLLGDRMRVIQIKEKVVGYENLPDKSVGYMPWRVDPDLWRTLTVDQRVAYTSTLARELQIANPEWTDDEVSGIARSWVNIMTNKANSNQFMTTSPFSRRGGQEVEDAIKAYASGNQEVQAALLAKHQKGQMNQTKSRLDRDLTAVFYTDEAGNQMRLMDVMMTNPLALFNSQAGRVSGEVAVNRFGIRGRAGMEQIKKLAIVEGASPEDIDAFDRIASEMLGIPFGGIVPGHAAVDVIQSIMRTMSFGGLIFAQIGEIFNMLPLVGLTGVLRVLGGTLSEARNAKLDARGFIVGDKLLDDLSQMLGGVGTDLYKYDLPIGETGRNFDVPYSSGNLSMLGRLSHTMENFQAKATFFHGVLAAQQRGVMKEALAKSSQWIRGGKGNKAMESMGLNQDLIDKLKLETDAFVYDKNGKLVEFHPSRAKDPFVMEQYVQSLRRGVGQIIQETFPGEVGDWVSKPVWKAMATFRGYVIGALQKQMARQVDDLGAWQAAGYFLASSAFIVPIQYAKSLANTIGMSEEERDEYLAKRLNPMQLAWTSLSYSALGGPAMEIASIGLAPFDTGLTTIRSGGRTSISQISPFLGTGENLMNVPGDLLNKNSEGEWDPSFNSAERLMPLGNFLPVVAIQNSLNFDE